MTERRGGEARPRFSVLLPTHNRADVVGFAIASILAQTDPSFELLVVGDGCTDGTADVVRSFLDPRVRWFDLPKAPHFGYANRNRALREARGELIAFMAHDDIVLPDHLELLGRCFIDPAVEWAYSRPLWVSDDGHIVPFAVDLRQPDQLAPFLEQRNTIPASCVVYRRSCHDRYGYWPEDLPHSADWAYWRTIVGPSRGANLAYLPQPTALHFRAAWRDGRRWGPDPLTIWLETARRGPWPAALSVPVADPELPQAAVWARVEREGDRWSAALRAAVGELFETLAWTHAIELSRRTAEPAPAPVADGVTRTPTAPRRLSATQLARRLRLRLRGNPLFDARWYVARYPDVIGVDPVQHWRTHGAREARDPNAQFSTSWYLATYPDVAGGAMNPLDHYYVYGRAEGRSAAPERRHTTSAPASPHPDAA